MKTIYFDTETCGLCGPCVIMQYAIDDGPVQIWNFWEHRANESVKFIEDIIRNRMVGFNLTFDIFHLHKIYTMLQLLGSKKPTIENMYEVEAEARDGPCLKPYEVVDLMLYARKNEFQMTMERKDIVIRRVPRVLGWELKSILEKIELPKILRPKWNIVEKDGFVDIVLKFSANSSLKNLALHALGREVVKFDGIAPESPDERGWCPVASLLKRGRLWPYVIGSHITHWKEGLPLKYAIDDVIYTRDLYRYFKEPEPSVDDRLTVNIATCRWRGYNIDRSKILLLRDKAHANTIDIPTAPNDVKRYLDIDGLESTSRLILEELMREGVESEKISKVLLARRSLKEVDMYNKLLIADRLHASLKVIGTLSGRMSGSDGLNPQGINRDRKIRSCFIMRNDNEVLSGGDFVSFEVVLADAVFNDENLRADLRAGKSIHGLFAQFVYPNMTYEQIMATKGTENDLYTKAKSAVFAMLYGGQASTLENRLGIPLLDAEIAYNRFCSRYVKVGKSREEIFQKFAPMSQPGGIGTAVIWRNPADYVSSLLGFRRYFKVENTICKALYELANNVPESWKKLKIQVNRKDRVQTACGAAQSALYAAAFSIQASNMRAAANHVIQSSGAEITKTVQDKIWSLQPVGIHDFRVRPMNVHDEIICPNTCPELVSKIVNETVLSFRNLVPLLEIDWKKFITNWGEK